MFVSAAVHGDEIIGVEIARRLLRVSSLKSLKGTLLVVPIVNTFGFINHSRYLPDRRDLNRSFPGSERGSLAGRLAYLFMKEIVQRSDIGIDLHSAAIHRTNLPQLRITEGDAELVELAKVFGAPVVLTSKLREGSLRRAAQTHGVKILLYEAGEGLRFDELAVRAGVTGIVRVMRSMEMISRGESSKRKTASIFASSSAWVRAPAGGLLRSFRTIGAEVEKGEPLGIVADPFGEQETEVPANRSGIIIGRTNLPVVNEGDALFHIAETKRNDPGSAIDEITLQLEADPLFDEDEII